MSLIIYNASAGSGKTYTLTRDYIGLAIDGFHAQTWKRILAVTFTNKAAAEMKDRIVIKLSEISNSQDNDLIQYYVTRFSINEDEIRFRTSIILNDILHHYSRLSVFTIDSFLQRIFRSFLYELDINYSFDLMLNANDVISESVNNFIFTINKNAKGFKDVIKLLDFSVENSDSFDIKGKIDTLSRELTKEAFFLKQRDLFEYLENEDHLSSLIDAVKAETQAFYSYLFEKASQILSIVEKNNMSVDDFSGKSRGIFSVLQKIAKKDFPVSLTDTIKKSYASGKWASNDNNPIFNNQISPVINQIYVKFEEENAYILGLKQILSNLYILNLLQLIDENRKQLLSQEGYFLLSDIPRVLLDIIKEGGAGFVYEKSGNRYDHFFIDEFQDTSRLQWQNFLPLIENSLSQNNTCYLAGDIKQAIYRWRNGDWTILAGGVNNDLPVYDIQQIQLDTNWRSLPAIINFNNSFFEKGLSHIQSVLINNENSQDVVDVSVLFADFFQQIGKKSKDEGYVHCVEFDCDKLGLFKEQVLEYLPQRIHHLWDNGCKDIAILVRTNSEISNVLDVLLESNPNFPIVTEQSFRLDTSPIIRFIISYLKLSTHKEDTLYNKQAIHALAFALKKSNLEYVEHSFHQNQTFEEYVNECGYSNISSLFDSSRSTYSQVCNILHVFGFDTISIWQPFISAFLDAVNDFPKHESGMVTEFIQWYQSKQDDLQIQVEDLKEAVKIMTIHKSKGLQFQSVILPFPIWSIKPKSNSLLWVSSNEKHIDALPTMPIMIKKDLENTIFNKDYALEKNMSLIDNINLLYVALTRAESQLDVYFFKGKDKELNTLNDLLFSVIPNLEMEICDIQGKVVYSSGKELNINIEKLLKEEDLILVSGGCNGMGPKMVSEKTMMQLYLTNNDEAIQHGLLLHALLEKVKVKEDLLKVTDSEVQKGMINSKEAKIINQQFFDLLKNNNIENWYSNQFEIYNERALINEKGQIFRPDRILIKDNTAIVIDYKTGIGDEEIYTKQMQQYVNLLSKMGYNNVEAWILQLDKQRVSRMCLRFS